MYEEILFYFAIFFVFGVLLHALFTYEFNKANSIFFLLIVPIFFGCIFSYIRISEEKERIEFGKQHELKLMEDRNNKISTEKFLYENKDKIIKEENFDLDIKNYYKIYVFNIDDYDIELILLRDEKGNKSYNLSKTNSELIEKFNIEILNSEEIDLKNDEYYKEFYEEFMINN